jgi:hypothetical protein
MTGAQGGEPGGSPRERTKPGATGRRRVPPPRRRDAAEAPPGATRVPKASWRAADIGIRPLKDFVVFAFPEDHPLRTVILAERDHLPPSEFLAKMEVWLVLLNRRA